MNTRSSLLIAKRGQNALPSVKEVALATPKEEVALATPKEEVALATPTKDQEVLLLVEDRHQMKRQRGISFDDVMEHMKARQSFRRGGKKVDSNKKIIFSWIESDDFSVDQISKTLVQYILKGDLRLYGFVDKFCEPEEYIDEMCAREDVTDRETYLKNVVQFADRFFDLVSQVSGSVIKEWLINVYKPSYVAAKRILMSCSISKDFFMREFEFEEHNFNQEIELICTVACIVQQEDEDSEKLLRTMKWAPYKRKYLFDSTVPKKYVRGVLLLSQNADRPLFDPSTLMDWINLDPENEKHVNMVRCSVVERNRTYVYNRTSLIQTKKVYDPRPVPTTLEARISIFVSEYNDQASCDRCMNIAHRYALCMELVRSTSDLEKMFTQEQVEGLLELSNVPFEYRDSIFESLYMPREFASQCVSWSWIDAAHEQDLIASIALLRQWHDETTSLNEMIETCHYIEFGEVFLRLMESRFPVRSAEEWFTNENSVMFLREATKIYVLLDEHQKKRMCAMFKIELPLPEFLFDKDMDVAFKDPQMNKMWITLCECQISIKMNTQKWNKSNANARVLKMLE